MVNKDFQYEGPDLNSYLSRTFHPEDDVLVQVRQAMEAAGLPEIQVGEMDGLHLQVLARTCGASKAVEIGTLGGYSGIHLLRGMGEGSHLWTFEKDPAAAEVARKSFELAGVSDRVTLICGDASEKLSEIEEHGPFDLVFIDADKNGYPCYLEWSEKNLRKGGLVIGDNTFAFGMIANTAGSLQPRDVKIVESLRKFNERVAQGGRFLGTILPTGEGLTVGVKL